MPHRVPGISTLFFTLIIIPIIAVRNSPAWYTLRPGSDHDGFYCICRLCISVDMGVPICEHRFI